MMVVKLNLQFGNLSQIFELQVGLARLQFPIGRYVALLEDTTSTILKGLWYNHREYPRIGSDDMQRRRIIAEENRYLVMKKNIENTAIWLWSYSKIFQHLGAAASGIKR